MSNEDTSIIEMVVIGFGIIILIGVLGYGFNLFYTSLVEDEIIFSNTGFNFTDAAYDTVGQINQATLNNLNLIGIMILFGMIIGMLINAYFNRTKRPKFFIIADIVIIIVAYVISVYISNTYELILATDSIGSFITTYLEDASQFLLNLPIIVVVTGILTMILTYSGIPRSREEEIYVGGLQ